MLTKYMGIEKNVAEIIAVY